MYLLFYFEFERDILPLKFKRIQIALILHNAVYRVYYNLVLVNMPVIYIYIMNGYPN